LRGRDDADDLHLLQDQRQREGREELGTEQMPKTTIDATSTISGTSDGVCVQDVLEPADETRFLTSNSATPVGLVGERRFEVLPFVCCHMFLPPRCGRPSWRLRGNDGRACGRRTCWREPGNGAPPSSYTRRSAPAEVHAFLDGDRLDALDRLVGHQRNAGVEEVLAFGRLRLGAVLGELGDRLDAL
jgi:hypothetical protein